MGYDKLKVQGEERVPLKLPVRLQQQGGFAREGKKHLLDLGKTLVGSVGSGSVGQIGLNCNRYVPPH